MKPILLITQGLHPDVVRRFESSVEFVFSDDTSAAGLTAAARAVDAVIVRTNLPPTLFDDCPRLCAAVRHGVGLDMIPVEAATRAGVPVANVPGANARTVAEFALMQMLSLARRQGAVQAHLRRGDWKSARACADQAMDLFGATVGIVGFGAIGRQLADLCRLGLGMQVLVNTRTPASVTGDGVAWSTLEGLLERSDWVVLACPLTDATRGLIGREQLATMKRSACLINVARGPVVVADALDAAVRDGVIRGAALDVHVTMPLPAGDPLLDRSDVLLTPHMAGITDSAMQRMGLSSVQQALDILAGHRPEHLVNPLVWDVRRRYARAVE